MPDSPYEQRLKGVAKEFVTQHPGLFLRNFAYRAAIILLPTLYRDGDFAPKGMLAILYPVGFLLLPLWLLGMRYLRRNLPLVFTLAMTFYLYFILVFGWFYVVGRVILPRYSWLRWSGYRGCWPSWTGLEEACRAEPFLANFCCGVQNKGRHVAGTPPITARIQSGEPAARDEFALMVVPKCRPACCRRGRAGPPASTLQQNQPRARRESHCGGRPTGIELGTDLALDEARARTVCRCSVRRTRWGRRGPVRRGTGASRRPMRKGRWATVRRLANRRAAFVVPGLRLVVIDGEAEQSRPRASAEANPQRYMAGSSRLGMSRRRRPC